jgi:hypothetical protein
MVAPITWPVLLFFVMHLVGKYLHNNLHLVPIVRDLVARKVQKTIPCVGLLYVP